MSYFFTFIDTRKTIVYYICNRQKMMCVYRDIGQGYPCMHIMLRFWRIFWVSPVLFLFTKVLWMNKTNLPTLRCVGNPETHNEIEKYLRMPLGRLVRLIVAEKAAKNKAYRFIKKRGLMPEFNNA